LVATASGGGSANEVAGGINFFNFFLFFVFFFFESASGAAVVEEPPEEAEDDEKCPLRAGTLLTRPGRGSFRGGSKGAGGNPLEDGGDASWGGDWGSGWGGSVGAGAASGGWKYQFTAALCEQATDSTKCHHPQGKNSPSPGPRSTVINAMRAWQAVVRAEAAAGARLVPPPPPALTSAPPPPVPLSPALPLVLDQT
jgi:hypothetical protein